MSSWTSWLPRLPSLNLPIPSSIQGRFISFILKRTLGHFLKPDQLESRQIDAQIGSGYVQVNDLDLNIEAINSYLSGLPLRLTKGTISSVTARIPWPNPLTSTLGFSCKSSHLTFCLIPPSSSPAQPSDMDLAGSVASVAETFIHEELTPREEASMWESIHPDLVLSQTEEQIVPGGIDPFLSAAGEETNQLDLDPAGVSIFATLIERLLAKFEFDADDVQITIVHPGNMNLTASVGQVRYFTEGSHTETPIGTTNQGEASQGESRTLSISGITITARNLYQPMQFSPKNSPDLSNTLEALSPQFTPRSASPISSSSSIDEETQFEMSQSLAFLPPRVSSPAHSTTSSMYMSAISTAQPPNGCEINHSFQEDASSDIQDGEDQETESMIDEEMLDQQEVLLSLGSSPTLIKLLTPPVPNLDKFTETKRTSQIHAKDQHPFAGGFRVSISIGLVACALRSWHIRGLQRLANSWLSLSSTIQSTKQIDANSASRPDYEVGLSIRGFVVLLVASENQTELRECSKLENYFSHPLLPPKLPHGYARLHLEGISASLLLLSKWDSDTDANLKHRTREKSSTNPLLPKVSYTLSVSDISLFSFHQLSRAQEGSGLIAFPLIITDPHLATQYAARHFHPQDKQKADKDIDLPSFDVIDWADEKYWRNGLKLSLWRSKTLQKLHKTDRWRHDATGKNPPSVISGQDEESSTAFSALSFHGSHSFAEGACVSDIEIELAPLHLFLHLGLALENDRLMSFLREVSEPDFVYDTGKRDGEEDSPISNSDLDQDTPPVSPKRRTFETATNTETVIIDDPHEFMEGHAERGALKSDMSYRPKRRHVKMQKRRFSAVFPFIRLEMRCPPVCGHPARSGAVVIDIHDVKLHNASVSPKPSARFSTTDPTSNTMNNPAEILLTAECKRLLLASSITGKGSAMSFFSMGPLTFRGDEINQDQDDVRPLPPRISLLKSSTGAQPFVTSINLEFPSIYIDITKPLLDSLQFWADDAAQLMERTISKARPKEHGSSKNTSIIGSRFFAKSSGSGTRSGLAPEAIGNAYNANLIVTEVFIRLKLPRSDKPGIRPFLISAADTSVVFDLRPQDKEQTAISLKLLDLTVTDISPSEKLLDYFRLASRSLISAPNSLVDLRFKSLLIPETLVKETRLNVTLCGFTSDIYPDTSWVSDLAVFVKSPPGTFESVIPSERTRISVKISDGSVRFFAPTVPGALISYIGDLELMTDIVGGSPDSSFHISVPNLSLLAIDNASDSDDDADNAILPGGIQFWKTCGYALVAELKDSELKTSHIKNTPPESQILIDHAGLRLHLCADTLAAVTAFIGDINSASDSKVNEQQNRLTKRPTIISERSSSQSNLMLSVDDLAFTRPPELGPAPDMINDDLPTNLDYLDDSFGAAGGLRELRDDDLDDFDTEDSEHGRITPTRDGPGGITSRIGGETIKILQPDTIQIVENFFDDLPQDTTERSPDLGIATLRVRIRNSDLTLFLYDGYDWVKTRKLIEEEVKFMRRRLAKIRQLVASGQAQDPDLEDTSALLFNSVYIGLDQDIDTMEPDALIAAIDEELKEDFETASQSSWQSLRHTNSGKPYTKPVRVHGKKLTRSKGPSMEFRLLGLYSEVDHYRPDEPLVSRTFVTVETLEILDHIKTSTWKKFLTELRSDSSGNVRESDSKMAKIELRNVRPVPGHPSEEVRLRAKILPLRLYVDQDAVDFLKEFFSFKNPQATQVDTDDTGTYIQLAEIFPIDLKLDYKPRRVDYRALREGRTIELMNFFHFDGAEMTLRHITLAGITGWSRLFEMLNDLWTPDVKATQLVEVISGVAPIRSVVNVGSGVADLVLLPIAQYKKDGRIVRGVQKGATAFVKSTAVEAIKMGARLATGTQVILEQAENVLGGQFRQPVTAESLQLPLGDEFGQSEFDVDEDENERSDLISKYAQQPVDLKEGMQSAYQSLRRNLSSAAQTILAVPMEVYERSGNEGPVRSVIRAVPIAVLKPMIGASEAVSKTLLGLHNTLDPNVRHDTEAKYKHR